MIRTVKISHPVAIKRFLQAIATEDLSKVRVHVKSNRRLPVYKDFVKTMDNFVATFLYWNTHPFHIIVSATLLEILRKNNNVVVVSLANTQFVVVSAELARYSMPHQRILPYEAISYVEYESNVERCNGIQGSDCYNWQLSCTKCLFRNRKYFK